MDQLEGVRSAMHPGLRSTFLNLLISVPVTVILALLSWHLIEHRFLKMKSAQFIDFDPVIAQQESRVPLNLGDEVSVPAIAWGRGGTRITYDIFRTFDLNWSRGGWYKQEERDL